MYQRASRESQHTHTYTEHYTTTVATLLAWVWHLPWDMFCAVVTHDWFSSAAPLLILLPPPPLYNTDCVETGGGRIRLLLEVVVSLDIDTSIELVSLKGTDNGPPTLSSFRSGENKFASWWWWWWWWPEGMRLAVRYIFNHNNRRTWFKLLQRDKNYNRWTPIIPDIND